jgi:hypothetical protein
VRANFSKTNKRETENMSRLPMPAPVSPTLPTLVTLLTLALSGCTVPRPLKGGKAITRASGVDQSLVQSDNPSASSRQSQQTVRVRTYTLPSIPITPINSINPINSVTVTEREETHAQTELGPAQKDNARELAAKLSSLKTTVWVGLALFVFGLASLLWPPLKLIIGSVTTGVALVLGGIALIILPTLIVGNELLILAAVAVTVGLWFLAHRHGHLRGLLQSSTSSSTIARHALASPSPIRWERAGVRVRTAHHTSPREGRKS